MVVFALACLAGAAAPGHAHARAIDPERMHQALLQNPIVDARLPAGLSGVQLVDVPVEPENGADGEIGNIDVTIAAGPDTLNGGAYTIYATAEQADLAIARFAEKLGGDVQVTSVEPLLSDWPAYLVTATMPDPPMGVTAYLIRMDSIVVAAFSGVLDQSAGNADNARALAVLMAQQVEWLSGAGLD
jgi:hypothetical protein